MKEINKIIIFSLFMVQGVFGIAQIELQGIASYLSIPNVTLMDIEPGSGSIGLALSQPTEAGMPTINYSTTNNTKWINYTSCNTASVNRKISVAIASGTIPSGTVLDLTASAYSGNGKGGTFGAPSLTIQLSNSSQTLINGISSCYTGDGSDNGHCLTYNWRVVNYGQLKTTSASNLILNFTMTDN